MRQGEKIQAVKLYREQTGVGLAEAKAAVEAIERGAPLPALDVNLEQQILDLLATSRKIEAIKLLREHAGLGLAEAKAAVESLERGVPLPGLPSVDGNLERQILEQMAAGNKIGAIKLHREQTNAGLKESKDYVEALAARHGIAPVKTGCLGAAAILLSAMVAVAAALCMCVSGIWI